MISITSHFGFKITLDDYTGLFWAVRSDDEGKMKSLSLSELKSAIEVFVEEHKDFKRFKVQYLGIGQEQPSEEYEVVGFSKEGYYIVEGIDDEGETYRETVYPSGEDNFILPDERNLPLIEEVNKINLEYDTIMLKLDGLKKQYHRKSLRDIRVEKGLVEEDNE